VGLKLTHETKKRTATSAATPAAPFKGTFFPPRVAKVYDYPENTTGKDQNIGIFAFNGGSTPDPHGGYSLTALNSYFNQVLETDTPKIVDAVVHGAGNNPGADTQASAQLGDATGEVMLDMCVVGSVAPAANISMFFTEFTTQGWADAIQEAVAGDHDLSVISISYGNPEDDPEGAWTRMGVKFVNQAFQAAAAKGITICCASGDDGSTDQVKSGAHVDFPASSPFVLGVGGTKLVASDDDANPTITEETVWNELLIGEGAGGGGISAIFTKPAYQNSVNVPVSVNPPHRVGRGVPDVAAVADPETGVVRMNVDGLHLEATGGTSASAPLWAALIVRLNEKLGSRCGFVNPLLYTTANTGVLHDITDGNNGAFSASSGWDACTGLGTPDGDKLFHALSAAASGGPQAVRSSSPRSRGKEGAA
jgi:kumamolisin